MYHKLKEKLCDLLDEYEQRGDVKAGDLDAIHEITDTLKNLLKIEMLKDGGEYSQRGRRGYSRDGGSYRYDGMDGGSGNSYANRGEHWVRGHYSRDDEKGHIAMELERLIDDTTDEQIRNALKQALRSARD